MAEDIVGLFGDALSKAVGKHQVRGTVIGTATNIRENVCDVLREGESTLEDVRLQAVEDNNSSRIIIKPKDKSVVICSVIENLESEACIIQCSEIDEFFIKIGDVEHKITAEKHTIKNGTADIWDAFNLFFQALEPIIILQGRNPDLVKLAEAKAKFKKIFNGT